LLVGEVRKRVVGVLLLAGLLLRMLPGRAIASLLVMRKLVGGAHGRGVVGSDGGAEASAFHAGDKIGNLTTKPVVQLKVPAVDRDADPGAAAGEVHINRLRRVPGKADANTGNRAVDRAGLQRQWSLGMFGGLRYLAAHGRGGLQGRWRGGIGLCGEYKLVGLLRSCRPWKRRMIRADGARVSRGFLLTPAAGRRGGFTKLRSGGAGGWFGGNGWSLCGEFAGRRGL